MKAGIVDTLRRKYVAPVLILSLTGCASVQPVVNASEPADQNAGYVAGLFTRMKTRGFAFVIRAIDGSSEYVMPLGEDSSLPTEVKDQTVAVKLRPGMYTVSQWITYATLTKEIMSRKDVDNPVLKQPFLVRPGSVIHLGSFDVSNQFQWLKIQPRRRTEEDLKTPFAAAYPNLAELPFRCVLCIETVGGR